MELVQILFNIVVKFKFFCGYFSNFPSSTRIRIQFADPDPGEEMNADPCGSGSTALIKKVPVFYN